MKCSKETVKKISDSFEKTAALTGIMRLFGRTNLAATLLITTYDLISFLVDVVNEAIGQNSAEEKRAFLLGYSNYLEQMMDGGEFNTEVITVNVSDEYAEWIGSLEVINYRNAEEVRNSFEEGMRLARDKFRKVAREKPDTGIASILFALAMLKYEHPNKKERKNFVQRRVAFAYGMDLSASDIV